MTPNGFTRLVLLLNPSTAIQHIASKLSIMLSFFSFTSSCVYFALLMQNLM